MRAAIYSRTYNKKSRAGLKYEIDCRRFCEAREWQIVETLVITEAGSPSTLNRPGIKQILEAATGGEFDILVIYELGMIAKVADLTERVINHLAQHNIKLAIVHEPTPEELQARFDRLPEKEKQWVKSKIANMVLRSTNRLN